MKTVLVDADGVLADFIGGLCEKLQEWDHNVTPDTFKHWELAKSLDGDALDDTLFLVGEREFCADLEPYDDAEELLEGLESLGFGNILCVTSPWNSDTWHRERETWLQEHLDFEREEIIFASGATKPHIRGDVLIEDHPGTCVAWLEANPAGIAILVDRPWNQDTAAEFVAHPRMYRADGADAILKWLANRAQREVA